MKSRDYAFAVLCCIGPLAFAAPSHASVPCTPGICKIQVTVDDSQTPCTVSLDKPDVSTTAPVNLRWNIVTRRDPAWVFTDAGIVFDDPEQFVSKSHTGDEIRFQNKATRTGDFKYTVHVEGCAPLDPYVRNK